MEELTNQGLEEDELNKNLELLKVCLFLIISKKKGNSQVLTLLFWASSQESYSILSSVEERRLYDWSLSRSENPEDYKWPFEMDITQTPPDESPPQVLLIFYFSNAFKTSKLFLVNSLLITPKFFNYCRTNHLLPSSSREIFLVIPATQL